MFGRKQPVVSAESVLRDNAHDERARYRGIDLSNILGRIERFSTSSVDAAWKSFGELVKKDASTSIDNPRVAEYARQSASAVANFTRSQLYDPSARDTALVDGLDRQIERWKALAAGGEGEAVRFADLGIEFCTAMRAAILAGQPGR